MKKAVIGSNSYVEEWAGCGHGTHAEIKSRQKIPYSKNIRNKYWKLCGNKHKKKKSRRISANLVSARTTKKGKLGMAKPCTHCAMALYNDPVIKYKYIYYSTNNETIIKIKLKDMIKTEMQVSNGHKKRASDNKIRI
jgi:hypothetical protein